MTDTPKKGPAPFSIRFTAQERQELDLRAGVRPLGAYIRAYLFENRPPRKAPVKQSVQDHKALSRLLAELGASHLANNLNQLAKSANMGTLDVSPDIEHELLESCREVHWMRRQLIDALGLKAR